MKVLVLTTTFPRWVDDPIPTYVYDLSKRLQDKGFDIIVLAPHYYRSKKFEIIENMKIYRFPYFYPYKYQKLCYNGGILSNLKSIIAQIQLPLFIFAYIYYILKITKNEKIDLIHAHWIIPSGFVVSIVKSIIKKPFIVSVHGSDIASANNSFIRCIIRHILRKVDICTANSNATKDLILAANGSYKRVDIIPMGVDTDKFEPFVQNKKQIILSVSRLNKNKGIDYLIDAMPKVVHKFSNVKLIVVGDGPEKDNLTNKIRKLNLENSVSLVGAIKNRDLPYYYNISDIFVLPSLKEGLGVVLLEAMACGTPVIGSNIGGIRDIIVDGQNGSFIEPGNSNNIAEKIIWILSNQEIRDTFSENGLKTVRERFSWDIVTEKFSNTYLYLPPTGGVK